MKVFLPALLCTAFLFARWAPAHEMTADTMLSFADHLFEQGDYYRAITEYERVIFFYPDTPLAKTARLQIALSYFKGEKLDAAIERLRDLAERYRGDETGKKALFLLGEACYRRRDYAEAADVFRKFIATYPDDERADTARVKLGWSSLRQGQWKEAGAEFRTVPAGSPLRAQAEWYAGEAEAYPAIPTKSPGLAGGLSAVLPGAGQLYVNRPGDAAASFLLNDAFLWATVDAFHRGEPAVGGIFLFFETGWYVGNIYNAVNNAYKYNRLSQQRYLEGVENRYTLSYSHNAGSTLVALTVRF